MRAVRNTAGAFALGLTMLAGPALAQSAFTAPVQEFKAQVGFGTAAPTVPVVAGAEVAARGRGFLPGQSVVLQRGTTLLTPEPAIADAEGNVTLTFTVPPDAATGQHPIVVIAENPSATIIATMKVSPEVPLSGAEKFTVDNAPVTRGLYQSQFSEAAGAVFVTSAVGRPPIAESGLLKLDPDTLQVLARTSPPEAPARADGSPGGVIAIYGVAVDDAHGNVWVTNTRQNTVAVYAQDDLALVKQFEPGTVSHARDVVVDAAAGRAYASAARSDVLAIFNTATLEQVGEVKVASELRGETFTVMSLELDPESGRLYTVSLDTPEAAVIDTAKGEVERIIPLPGALGASGVAVDPQDNLLFVASQGSDNLLILDLASGEVLHDVPVGAGPLNVEFDPVSRLAFVSLRGAGTIAVVDTAGQIVANLDAGSYPNHASADGKGRVWAVNKSAGEDDPEGDHLWRITPVR